MKKTIYIITIVALFFTSCKKQNKEDHSNHDHSETELKKNDEHTEDAIHLSKAQFESNKMELGAISKQNFPEIVKTTGMIDVPPQSKQIITSFYGGFV
ncbi:MAG TPA: efflux transporter periplasmic adaptor subunit, partial [Flavobacteriaceae bacterium]|nr:efflux transporter periplasmic adaptor subunit [Flavobacteriaceae bacterium]